MKKNNQKNNKNKNNETLADKALKSIINEQKEYDNEVKADKYGVRLDSKEYLDLAGIASHTDYTGFVPAAILTSDERDNYEETFDVPVGNVDNKEELFDEERKKEIKNNKIK